MRYVAIVKPMKYKAVVTNKRLKLRFAVIVWITALTISFLFFSLEAVGLLNKVTLVILVIFQFLTFTLLVYFYGIVYIEIRKRSHIQFSEVIF